MDPEQQVELLRRQYLQLQDPAKLDLLAPTVLKLPTTQARIYDALFRERFLACPPPVPYQVSVLKRLISCLEAAVDDPEEDEIHDDLAETLGRFMAEPRAEVSTAARHRAFVTYTAPRDLSSDPLAPSVTLLEAPALLAASGTTGLRTWEAALYMGRFLDSPAGRPFVEGQNVLELGAGTGFVSVLAAKHLSARFVMATDGSREVVDGLVANAELNGLAGTGRIGTAVLKWGHALPGAVLSPVLLDEAAGPEERFQYDLIVGADVTYDGKLMWPLVGTLQGLLRQYPDAKALVAATLRNERTHQEFQATCRNCCLHLERLLVDDRPEDQQLGFFHSIQAEIALFLATIPLGQNLKRRGVS